MPEIFLTYLYHTKIYLRSEVLKVVATENIVFRIVWLMFAGSTEERAASNFHLY